MVAFLIIYKMLLYRWKGLENGFAGLEIRHIISLLRQPQLGEALL